MQCPGGPLPDHSKKSIMASLPGLAHKFHTHTMFETDYGYDVHVYDNTNSSLMLYNTCLDIYEPDGESTYTEMRKISHLICDAVQGNGNILVCSCSHVQEQYI